MVGHFLVMLAICCRRKQPNFDSRNYGYQKLTPLIKSIKSFEIDQRESPKGRFKLVYVKNRENMKGSK